MEKLCKRCPQAPDCHLDYLQEECRQLRKENCPDIRPNRAEIIAAMTLDEMATKLVMPSFTTCVKTVSQAVNLSGTGLKMNQWKKKVFS